MSEEDQED